MYQLISNGAVIASQDAPIEYNNAQYAWQTDNALICDTDRTMTVEFVRPVAEMQAEIVEAVQRRLDSFAQTRNYDNILSACTYASSSVPRFASEGQAAVDARDATWATLYTLLGEVQAGTRPMPESFADVEPLLPVLEWPA